MSSILSPKQPNTKLYLPFSEGSGSTAYDYSDEGNNGTITGATYVKIKDGGYALNFNGSSDYLLANGVATSIGAIPTEFSIRMSLKRISRTSYDIIWAMGDTTPSGGSGYKGLFLGMGSYNNDNLWYWGYYEIFDTGFTLVNDVWYDIVFTLENSTTARIYINGNQVWTGTISNRMQTDSFIIGKDIGSSDHYLNAHIKQPIVYKKTLSPQEIKKLYQETYIE